MSRWKWMEFLAGRRWTRDPVSRRAVKLGLDLLAAVLSLAAACAALGLGAPPLAWLAGFAAPAMAVNLAFGFHAQHYRAVGPRDAWRLMLGSLGLAGGVVALGLARPQGWPGLGPGPLLGASLLLGPLWLGLRMACRVLQRRGGAASPGPVPRIPIDGVTAGQTWKRGVRDSAIEHLLRRDPVALDGAALRAEMAGSVVLITGGGGFIGRELARAVAGLGPERVVLLGHGENSLWEAQRVLARQVPRLPVEVALCDIRNRAGLRQTLQHWRPEVVLHAAAHKHAPFLEDHPEEAVENNILGTRQVLEAAREHGTRIFVNLSTDRAAKPVSVLGVSKRIAEQVVAGAAAPGARLVTVRLGNVLGSRGSVVPVFMDQIRRGGPVTVTHPDIARYFLTLREAAQLALLAGLQGGGGKVFALDMGEPVRIADLAREMIRLAGYRPGADMDLRFTGLRPGEQLYADLFTAGEVRPSQVHPKVFEVLQDPPDAALLAAGLARLEALAALPGPGRQRGFLDCFMALVPSYRPSPTGLGRAGAGDGGTGLGAIA